jgi:hypothetical protein
MRAERLRPYLWLAVALVLSGCQSPKPLSYWGNYETIAYNTYRKPGDVPPETLILKLNEDLEKATRHGLNPNPGLHAYLGYAYCQAGKPEEALKHFEAEKNLYPESACFMDRLISKLKKK